MLAVLYHRAKFGGVRISPTAGAAKKRNVEFLFVRHCQFVCLPVMLLNDGVSAYDFAMKARVR